MNEDIKQRPSLYETKEGAAIVPKSNLTFRAWDGEKWQYQNLFLSHDGKLWLRYDGRKLKEVDWKIEFNYKQNEAHD